MASATHVGGVVSLPRESARADWAVVAAFACVAACTQMLWLTFAPIDTDVARDFGVSKNAIGWLAQVFPLLYVLLALPAGILLDRWFRGSLLAGAALTALGSALRLVSPTFLWALVGQLTVALAQPLVLNATTKVASAYLPRSDRPTGIAVASAAQFFGALLALAMGPALADSHGLGPLLTVQAVIACSAGVALVAGLRHIPGSAGPPAAIGLAEARSVWRVALIRKLSWLAFVGVGVFVSLSTWLQPVLERDRISSAAAGAMLSGMLLAGIAGCAVMPPIVARHRAERTYLTTTVVWVAACCAGLAVLHSVSGADFVLIFALGFVLLAALPVMLELTERRMGASGGVATGILLLIGNAGGLLVAVLVGAVVDVPTVAFLVIAAVILMGLPAARRVSTSGVDPVSRSAWSIKRSEQDD